MESATVDRSVALGPRLERFYIEYAKMLHTFEWTRIYLHAGLAGASVNKRFGRLVTKRVYRPIINELRLANGQPGLAQQPASEPEMEMMWALHGSIFYIENGYIRLIFLRMSITQCCNWSMAYSQIPRR
jgi:hypothetical protein